MPSPPRDFRLDLRRLSRADQAVGAASLVVLVSLFLPWFGFGTLGANISIAGTTAHGYLVIVVITALLTTGYLLVAGPTLTGPRTRLRRPPQLRRLPRLRRLRRPLPGQRSRGHAGQPPALPGQVGLIGIACIGRDGGQVEDLRASVDT